MKIDNPRLFQRDGHLTDLTIDRHVLGDLSRADRAEVDAHLKGCLRCQVRLDAAKTTESEAVPEMDFARLTSLNAPRPGRVVSLEAARRRRNRFTVAGGVLALAASAAIVLWTVPNTSNSTSAGGAATGGASTGDDGIRVKAGTVDLEVYLDDGVGGTRLLDGAAVQPGQRIGFRYRVRAEGYLAIRGRDSTGATYPCFPQAPSNGATGTRVTPTEGFVTPGAAIRFDDRPGTETITALLCTQPIEAAWFEDGGPLPAHCARDTVTLVKSSP